MNSKTIVQSLYGFFAAIFLIAGASVLAERTGLLPDAVRNVVLDIADGDFNAVHLLQEFGSMLVFAGLISIWFMRRYEESKFFHWAMTTFWALFAFAHWFDPRGTLESVVGPAIDTIPFVLFLITGLLRNNSRETND